MSADQWIWRCSDWLIEHGLDRRPDGTDWDLIAEALYAAVQRRLPPEFVAQTYLHIGGFESADDESRAALRDLGDRQ